MKRTWIHRMLRNLLWQVRMKASEVLAFHLAGLSEVLMVRRKLHHTSYEGTQA